MDSNSRLIVLALILAIGPLSAQELVVKNNELLLPPMFEDAVITNAFVVSNLTAQPVIITRVQPTCGCTFARSESNSVPAHGTSRIIFGYHASRQPGSVSKKIIVFTPTAQVFLAFTATVKAIFTFDRYSIDLKEIVKQDAGRLTASLLITPADGCTNATADSFSYNASSMNVDWSWDRKARLVIVKLQIDASKYTNSPYLRDGFSFNLLCNGQNSRQYYVPVTANFK